MLLLLSSPLFWQKFDYCWLYCRHGILREMLADRRARRTDELYIPEPLLGGISPLASTTTFTRLVWQRVALMSPLHHPGDKTIASSGWNFSLFMHSLFILLALLFQNMKMNCNVFYLVRLTFHVLRLVTSGLHTLKTFVKYFNGYTIPL